MSEWRWTMLDSSGTELRSSETFDSKQAAEQWLTATWRGLLDEGARSVSLTENGREEYRMGLTEQ
jgi:hypothetical protein